MALPVHVDLGSRSYDIHVGEGLLDRVGALAATSCRGRNSLLVSDATVAPLYGARVTESLTRAGFQVGRAVVPAGESSKDGRWLFHVLEKAVEQGLDRKSCIFALGGGVVGDLAGFAAAVFLRGIDLVQIPTTLLSMVDSAVGGKTGINLPQGKNLVGCFHQPRLVVCDLTALGSLPRRELVSGLAEVVKYGVIRDAALFQLIEEKVERILGLDPDLLARIVSRSCEIKAAVVGQDEREETGLRAILNFGHTLGHAVETVSGYKTFLHGEAIGIGMSYAGRLSVARAGFPPGDHERLVRLLQRLGLPTDAPEFAWPDLRMVMGVDKKSAGGQPRFVLAERLGHVVTGCEVPEDVLQQVWMQRVVPRAHGF